MEERKKREEDQKAAQIAMLKKQRESREAQAR